jgi:hypothetical protein
MTELTSGKKSSFGDQSAWDEAFGLIHIDGSNKNEVLKRITPMVKGKDETLAKIIVADALGEKRVIRAMQWLEENNFNVQEAHFTLAYEFVPQNTQPFRIVTETILAEAFRRLRQAIP